MTDDELKNDPRTIELVNCLLFALQAFRNKPLYDQQTKKMEGWHQWFKRAIHESGWTEFPLDDLARKGK